MKKISIFDQIINELTVEDSGTEQLDQCMQFNYSLSRKVPLRYKIISIGFMAFQGFTRETFGRQAFCLLLVIHCPMMNGKFCQKVFKA